MKNSGPNYDGTLLIADPRAIRVLSPKALMKICLVLLSLISLQAFGMGLDRCKGTHNGKKLLLTIQGDGINPRKSDGTLFINGIERAHFSGDDLKINMLLLSASVKNAQGDAASGVVTDLLRMKGIVHRLKVRGLGIDYRNVAVECWTKK